MKDFIQEFSVCTTVGDETVFITSENEDSLKLTQNYDNLVKKYSQEVSLLTYINTEDSLENTIPTLISLTGKTAVFPITIDCRLHDKTIEVYDFSNKTYQLPQIVVENEDTLFLAHSKSTVYDGTNIRVDRWGIDENGIFMIETSRTTYFNSLLTNRAIDFKLPQGITLRNELFDRVYDLEESTLSNHLGFNGWVRSSDGYYAFTKRGKKLSIGKNTYGNSVNASMKASYALMNDDTSQGKSLTVEGIYKSILMEIQDEMKIAPSNLEEKPTFLATYRDLVEGGKPQLLFHIQCGMTKDEINNNFYKELGSHDEEEMIVDGREFMWIHESMLENLYITADSMTLGSVKYIMTPSAAAGVVMLIEYLNSGRG